MRNTQLVIAAFFALLSTSAKAQLRPGPFTTRIQLQTQLQAINQNPQQPVRLAILGDTQNALGGNLFMQRFGQVAEAVARTNPDLTQTVGDNIYLGWPIVQRLQWRLWRNNAQPLLAAGPVLPGWGNHDADSNAIYRYFALPREPSARFRQGAYAYDIGSIHVAVVNDNTRLIDPALYMLPSLELRRNGRQYRWLEKDLASVPEGMWTVIVAHKPPYSVNGGYLDTRNLTDLTDQYGVDLFISGHTHTYETSVPITNGEPVSDGSQGTIYLVAGTSGARPANPFSRQPDWLRSAQTGNTGFVLIDATPQTMDIQSYTVDGQLFDRMVLTRP